MDLSMKRHVFYLFICLSFMVSGCAGVSTSSVHTSIPIPKAETVADTSSNHAPQPNQAEYDVVLHFPAEKYPETATHIINAIENGESSVCTIDRKGADQNREESLEGIPTKKGYDRDEWPMAMCSEGGEGADVAYVQYSDNRGSGSWVGNQLEDYTDGTKVLFVIDGGKAGEVQEAKSTESKDSTILIKPVEVAKPESVPAPTKEEAKAVYYANCSAVKAAGAAPLYEGDPGYRIKLDRDKDGVACEK